MSRGSRWTARVRGVPSIVRVVQVIKAQVGVRYKLYNETKKEPMNGTYPPCFLHRRVKEPPASPPPTSPPPTPDLPILGLPHACIDLQEDGPRKKPNALHEP